MDNFFTSVKMASVVLKMGWTMMGTISTRRSSGLPLKGHVHLPGTTWKIGDDIFLEIHKGELGKRSSNNADSIRSQNNIDERNLCYVNKEGCFIYNFPHERGDNSFFMISTKPFSHDMLMKNLAGRQKYYAEENRMPMTKPISQIQDFYNKYMNAVDIADQCALEYSKEDSKFYRSTRWVNVIFSMVFRYRKGERIPTLPARGRSTANSWPRVLCKSNASFKFH